MNRDLTVAVDQVGSVWHVFTVLHPSRDALARELRARGIGTQVFYPAPPHLSGAYAHLRLPAGQFPIAEQLALQSLALPIGPYLCEDEVSAVVHAVREACEAVTT